MKQVTAGIIINDENKILIAQRSREDKLSLKWEFPGGKIMEGESLQECLRREIMEELCLDIEVGSFFAGSIYNYESGSIELLAFFARTSGSKIKLMVHNDARWIDKQEILEYDFAAADIPIVKKLAGKEV